MRFIGQRIFSSFPNEEKVAYARSAIVNGRVFLFGTTGFDAETKAFPPDVETQCENFFGSIATALEQASASLADLLRVLTFVANEADFDKVTPTFASNAMRPSQPTLWCQQQKRHVVFLEFLLEAGAVEFEPSLLSLIGRQLPGRVAAIFQAAHRLQVVAISWTRTDISATEIPAHASGR